MSAGWHDPEYQDEARLIPGGVDRRAAARDASAEAHARRMRLAPRGFAAAIDTAIVVSAGSLVTLVSPAAFWISLSTTAIVYYGASTILTGASLGMRLTELLQQRIPALFAVENRRAHA